MTDTDGVHGILADVLDLKRQVAEKDDRIDQWEKEVIKWQDTDTKNQAAIEILLSSNEERMIRIESQDAEIDDLKKGFIDVDAAFAKDARIADLERTLSAAQKNGVHLLRMCSQKTNEIAEKDDIINQLETSNPACDLIISAQNKITKWKKEVIKWQDTDTENQEAIEAKDAQINRFCEVIEEYEKCAKDDVSYKGYWKFQQQNYDLTTENLRFKKEIDDLKRRFIDVDAMEKIMPKFTEEQIRGWIREEEDVIRAWIADEMSKFFKNANKVHMDQQIKVIEACGFKVISEEGKED